MSFEVIFRGTKCGEESPDSIGRDAPIHFVIGGGETRRKVQKKIHSLFEARFCGRGRATVKSWGKSPRVFLATGTFGKPHPEQDQISSA